jgi:hypothetical protein
LKKFNFNALVSGQSRLGQASLQLLLCVSLELLQLTKEHLLDGFDKLIFLLQSLRLHNVDFLPALQPELQLPLVTLGTVQVLSQANLGHLQTQVNYFKFQRTLTFFDMISFSILSMDSSPN